MVNRNATFRQMLNELDGWLAQLDSATLPNLTNQTAEDVIAKAKRVMGDCYREPAVNLFDYGD